MRGSWSWSRPTFWIGGGGRWVSGRLTERGWPGGGCGRSLADGREERGVEVI
jgi:hypothetical protein